jgi:hypothetical protein
MRRFCFVIAALQIQPTSAQSHRDVLNPFNVASGTVPA